MVRMWMRYGVFWGLILCFAAPSASGGTGRGPRRTARAADLRKQVDAYVAGEMAKRHIPGASVAIVKDGNIVLAKGYGLANVELNVPATSATVYEIGSITKQFTATAIMMLVEEGKVELDEKITKYLDGLPDAWGDVTVRHLLTHTSGIKSYTSVPTFLKTLRQDFTKQEIVNLVSSYPLDFKPGERFSYDNTGYFLLGMILEKVSGQPYGVFLQERIFAPLGMTSTRVNDLHDVIPNRASGYSWDGVRLRNAEYTSMTQPFAAGVLASTVLDLAKWDAALYTERLVKRSSLEQMWTPAKLNDGKPTDYGFGWGVGTYLPNHKGVLHGGGIPGFTTFIDRLMADHLTVILLTNQDHNNPSSMAEPIAAIYLPALAKSKTKTAASTGPVSRTGTPIEDRDPRTTARLKTLLVEVIRGKADQAQFTPKMQELLFGKASAPLRKEVAGYGTLKSFQLVAETAEGDGRVLQYRAVLGRTPVEATFALMSDGRIDGLALRPE